LGDAAKTIINQFINVNFDAAIKKVYYLLTKPEVRDYFIKINLNNDNYTYTNPTNYLFNIKLLTKKYKLLSFGANRIMLSDKKEIIIELLCMHNISRKRRLYNNILGYYNDGIYIRIYLMGRGVGVLIDM